MDKKLLQEFQSSSRDYLNTQPLNELRAYGRKVGVEEPTKKRKDDLITDIVDILSGIKQPIKQSKRGAPVKSDYFDPQILQKMEEFRCRLYPESTLQQEQKSDVATAKPWKDDENLERLRAFRDQPPNELVLCSSTYKGQLTKIDALYWLLPLNCSVNGEKLLMAEEFVKRYDLRVGDVIDCLAKQSDNFLIVVEIVKVNGTPLQSLQREKFDEADASYPSEKLQFYKENVGDALTGKYLDWLLPVYRGQRGIVLSLPKAGKSRLLYTMAQNLTACEPDVVVLALLVGQSPEEISRYRKTFNQEQLVYTTYDDDSEWQVFTANFLLERAKRFAESGKDVVLFVDGLNVLARAYNETKDSVGGKLLVGGLESKTLQYIKKFFGSARNLEKSGSLTIVASLSYGTGDPADELLKTEVSALANLQLDLDEKLAEKRLYPALDLFRSRTIQAERVDRAEENRLIVLQKRLSEIGAERLREQLVSALSLEEIR